MGVCPIFGILTCVHREHFCPPSTSAQNWAHLSWLDQSKRPHLNLGRDRCILFGTGSCMAILSAQQSTSWSIELRNQIGYSGRKSYRRTWIVLLQSARCHGNLPLQHPAECECLYRLYIPCYHPTKHSADAFLSPSIPHQFTPPQCRCDAFQHLTTHLDAFRQFWHILRYIYFEQDGTDPNICNRNGVKMVTSDS